MLELPKRGPARTARIMLTAGMLGACYLDFFAYKVGGFDDRAAFMPRLMGQASAPDQYRLGVYAVAQQMVLRLHIAPTMALAILDGIAGMLALWLLFAVLERSELYTQATRTVQWFGAAAFVLLAAWFMAWLLYLQKPETLPAAACVAAMLWLWTPRPGSIRPAFLTALSLLAMTALLASFRADLVCLLNAGILLFLLARRERLSLPRPAAIATAAVAALGSGVLQWWLMRVAYPQASYGRVKMWQLWPNFKHGSRWPPFLVFLLPLGWLALQAIHGRLPKDPAGRAFACGAILYAALWLAIGKIDEVRIFLPMALALAPLTVQAAMFHVEQER